MFTGIIECVGRIIEVKPIVIDTPQNNDNTGLTLTIEVSDNLDFLSTIKIGDSIALQGACMTVTSFSATHFIVDVSKESLSKTVGLTHLGRVNLEKAVSLSTPLGGHLVTGHVDGLGVVSKVEMIGESIGLSVMAPLELARFFAIKGSAVINGVSLTVNTLTDHSTGCDLHFNLIPHTWNHTTMSDLKVGDRVNLEIDLIARYLERMNTFKID